jgi:hypothetical protein
MSVSTRPADERVRIIPISTSLTHVCKKVAIESWSVSLLGDKPVDSVKILGSMLTRIGAARMMNGRSCVEDGE